MAIGGAVSVTAHAVDDTKAKMAKLSDTQLIVLSKAAQREDGAAHLPNGISPPAARKLGAALVAKKLMREVRSKPAMPVWRSDDNDRPISLLILRAGRDALGLDDAVAPQAAAKSPARRSSVARGKTGLPTAVVTLKNAASSKPAVSESPGMATSGSKRSQVIGMLSASAGATVTELVALTGWLPHTTRAIPTGLRKEDFAVERQRPQGASVSAYRIVSRMPKAKPQLLLTMALRGRSRASEPVFHRMRTRLPTRPGGKRGNAKNPRRDSGRIPADLACR